MRRAVQTLMKSLEPSHMLVEEPMREHTSFRIGGPAELLLAPKSAQELCGAIARAKDCGVPWCVIGNGTNLLVRDEGIEGLVIRIGGEMSGISYAEKTACVQAGALMSAFSASAMEQGLMGLEWGAGIPGSVGGAIAMNAGAYGGEIRQVLRSVTYLEDGEIQTAVPLEGDLGYRRSAFCAPGRIVLCAEFALQPDDGGARERMRDFAQRRREKQPLSYPSAGSTFKRPEGYFAGALIEQAGLKGVSIGGAQVSTLHAGFIINTGGATCADVLALIGLVQRAVLEQSGVMLEPEVKVIGGRTK